jgi:hypothetical protein
VDRHVLTSREGSADTGIDTFGWSGTGPVDFTGDIPWGVPTAREDDPPRLDGPIDHVLSPANLNRLQFAFLHVGERLGFSVWGAVGSQGSGSSRWRVVTHTLLFGEDVFHALAGNPFFLLGTARKAASWLVELGRNPLQGFAPLEPIWLAGSCAAAREHWRAELLRLRTGLLDVYGAERLERWVGVLHGELAHPGQGTALWTTPDRRHELLIRFAWLSLPVAERLRIPFITEQENRNVQGRLMALDAREWEGRIPRGAKWLDQENLEFHAQRSPGLAERVEHWVAPLVRSPDGRDFFRRFRDAERWGMGVLQGVTWPGFRAVIEGTRQVSVAELPRLLESVRGDPGSTLARGVWIGRVAGQALARAEGSSGWEEILASLDTAPAWRRSFVHGVVRGLRWGTGRGGSPRAAAGLFRCRATARWTDEGLAADLARLEGPHGAERSLLKPLLDDPQGPEWLLKACASAALARDAGGASARLARRAIEAAPDLGAPLAGLANSLDLSQPAALRWTVDLMDAVQARGGIPAKVFPQVASWLANACRGDAGGKLSAFLTAPDQLRYAVRRLARSELESYLRGVGPRPVDVAEALNAGWGDMQPDAKPAAVAWLAGGEDAGWIADWAARSPTPAVLEILAHGEWRKGNPRLCAAAASEATALVESALSQDAHGERLSQPRPPGGLTNEAVTTVLLGAGRDLDAASETPMDRPLVRAGLRFLVRRRAIRLSEAQLLPLLEYAGPEVIAELGREALDWVRESRSSPLVPSAPLALMRIMLRASAGDPGLLTDVLEVLPWRRDTDFWRRIVRELAESHRLGPDAVLAFAHHGDPGLAGEVFRSMVTWGAIGPPLGPMLELLRVEVERGGGPAHSLKAELSRNPAGVLELGARLLAERPPLPVYLAVRRALLDATSATWQKPQSPIDAGDLWAISPAVARRLAGPSLPDQPDLFIMAGES